MLNKIGYQSMVQIFQIVFLSFIFLISPVWAADKDKNNVLHIDIPVELAQAKVVFNMDHLAFEGDNRTGLNFMHVMVERFIQNKTQSNIVAIFHGEIGYMMLSDVGYNKARHTTRGNPYKSMIETLQAKGVQFEECGQTSRVNGWVNADFLPGIKINTSANLRIVQLVQQGYIQIQP